MEGPSAGAEIFGVLGAAWSSDPHRLLDVLELLVAGIGKGGVDLAAHLPECVIGDADAASFGNAFQPRGNVDAVAEDVTLVDDDVADMNPDAQFDAPVGGFVRIALRHSALLLDGAAGGVHGAAEFDQDAVTGAFDVALIESDGV